MITKKVIVTFVLTLAGVLILNNSLFISNATGEVEEIVRMYYGEENGEFIFFTTYAEPQYTYLWTFGDGNTSTEQNPSHLYIVTNSYNVTLKVSENGTIIFNRSMTLSPTNIPPTPDFYYSPNYPFTLETVYFWDNSTDIDGWIVNWSWDFDNDMIVDAYGPNVNHSYSKAGTYNVTLTVVDNQLMAKSVVQQIIVQNRVPVASFIWMRQAGSSQLIFDASTSSDPDGVIWVYTWDFGDGVVVTEQNNSQTEHLYATQGVYTVKLTVRDNSGGSSSFSRTIHSNNQLPVVNFTVTPSMPTDLDNITFNSTAYDPDGNSENLTYTWQLGDGTISYNETVKHKYADDGVYTVRLKVVDNEGATNQTFKLITVYNVPPVADFEWVPLYPIPNKNITFNATASYDLDGSITQFQWTFGDGMTGTGQVINHSYAFDGTYIITLTVKDDDEVSTTVQKTLFIADFYVDENIFDPLNHTWDTIQSAIDNASDGIYIYVLPGIYTEDVFVSKAVQIVADEATVLGDLCSFRFTKDGIIIRNFIIGSTSIGITIDANDCVVENCTLTVNEIGLSVHGDENVIRYNHVESSNTSVLITGHGNTLQYNTFLKGFVYGCYLQGDGNIIRYNNFSGLYGTGIYGLYVSGNGNTIQHNTIYNMNHGIYLLHSNEITGNTFTQCFNGINVKHFSTIGTNNFTNNTNGIMASSPFTITGSYFENNKVAINATMITAENLSVFGGDSGIQADNGTISRTTINEANVGVLVRGTIVLLHNCTLSNCSIGIEGNGKGELTDCTFFNNSIAINQIENTIIECEFLFNFHALNISKSTVLSSTFAYNDYGAILAKNVLLSQCLFTYNNIAISITTGYNTLTNNSIENNSYGIMIASSNNELQHNIIKNNSYGIVILFASYNRLLQNTLDNNTYNFDIEGDKLPDFYQTIPENNMVNGKPMKYLIHQQNKQNDTLNGTLDGGQYGYIGLVQCTNITLKNVNIGSNGEGLLIVYSDNITVENATLFNNKDGIYLLEDLHVYLNMVYALENNNGLSAKSTNYMIITNGIFDENINGVNLFSLERTTYMIDFINLSISANERGINIENIEGITIHESAFSGNAKGLRALNSKLTVTATTFNNTVGLDIIKTAIVIQHANFTGTTVINFADSSILTLNQSTIHDTLTGCVGTDSSLAINHCTVTHTTEVFNISRCNIIINDSHFSNNTKSMIDNSTIILTESTFLNNTDALFICYSSATLVDVEFFTNNNALIIDNSTVNVTNITLSGNEVGVTVLETAATLNGGTAQNNTVAIVIQGNGTLMQSILFHHNSKAVVIHGYYNTLVNCSLWKNLHGVQAYNNNNSIYHNNFIFNVEDARDYGNNRWNGSYLVGGNYWYAYAGEDHFKGVHQNMSGSDGIGDIPYELHCMSRFDYFPLMTLSEHAAAVPNEQPIAHFYYYPMIIYSLTGITFVDTSYDENGGNDIVAWTWNFGDGNTSIEQNPNHVYSAHGTFNVSLTIKDKAGSQNISRMQLHVLNLPPIADIEWTPLALFSNTLATFDAAGSKDYDGTITNYTWNFGDGTTGRSVSLSHQYTVPGTYTVTLMVTDNSGATNETSVLITIINRAPDAAFVSTDTEPNIGDEIRFTDKSTDTDGTLVEWHWDFDDGTFSIEQNPTHTYDKKGTYTVTLHVRDNEGSEATHTTAITVKEKNVPALEFVYILTALVTVMLLTRRLKKLK